ncbi:uncharacterized protein LOC129609699 [Condylostylus longicornis]|uniref:uncharacterized protein LOC129609699 n=1 Tax=Condylostylus longicornis TaxID=2530218 RepID=UPI00244DC0BE|nr:uncharacterized protein LOC129609699 [Condylostylus longicornis]
MNLYAQIRVSKTENTLENPMTIAFDSTDITTKKLKSKISRAANLNENEIEILYRGKLLEDNSSLDILPDSIVQVIKKTKVSSYTPKTYTKTDCERIAKLFGTVTGTQINVAIRINILTKILLEYPEFRRNLGAQALIRDSVLFHSLDKPEVIEKVAENYSIICDAAEFIVKTTKKELAKNVNNVAYTITEEVFSDYTSSSSEEENSSNGANHQQRMIRRITHDQLQAALSNMGSGSRNSLSNIAQRNANLIEEQQRSQQSQGPSNSQGNFPINRISSSHLNNALQRALMRGLNSEGNNSNVSPQTSPSASNPGGLATQLQSENVETMDTQETPTVIVDDSSLDDLPARYRNHQYAKQMRQMREMGLKNDEVNASVLGITGGNVENAVNLVLTSNFENDFGNLGGSQDSSW